LLRLIDAEAARDNAGRWRADSVNRKSGAAGLSQFLSSTWISEAQRRGTVLNAYAREQGLLDSRGLVLRDKRDALLAARSDSALSINAAADYARANLAALRAAGVLDQVTDESSTARALYLAHFAGAAGAADLVNGRMDALRGQLLTQAYAANVPKAIQRQINNPSEEQMFDALASLGQRILDKRFPL